MSSRSNDDRDHRGTADIKTKPPYPTLEIKKLSPTDALHWLESKASSGDGTQSEQIEDLKREIRAWIPDEIDVSLTSESEKKS